MFQMDACKYLVCALSPTPPPETLKGPEARLVPLRGGVAHPRLDHRCLRRLRPRLDGPLALERAWGPPDRGPAVPADVLPARGPRRAAGDPPADRDPGRRPRGAGGPAADRPRGRRGEGGPRDRPAALPRHPRDRAHPRFERRVHRPPAVQRGPALLTTVRDGPRALPDGPRAVRERHLDPGGGALRPRVSAAAAETGLVRPARRPPRGPPAEAGQVARRAPRRHRTRRIRGDDPARHRRGRAVDGPGHPHDGRRGRIRYAVPRAEGRGTWRRDETRPRPGQGRRAEGESVVHVWQARRQTGTVHSAWSSAPGPRAFCDARERLRGP